MQNSRSESNLHSHNIHTSESNTSLNKTNCESSKAKSSINSTSSICNIDSSNINSPNLTPTTTATTTLLRADSKDLFAKGDILSPNSDSTDSVFTFNNTNTTTTNENNNNLAISRVNSNKSLSTSSLATVVTVTKSMPQHSKQDSPSGFYLDEDNQMSTADISGTSSSSTSLLNSNNKRSLSPSQIDSNQCKKYKDSSVRKLVLVLEQKIENLY